jgi:hypothetical protein
MEFPALFLPVLMRETGQKGAEDGEGKKHTTEQIVSLLRQIEVAVANGENNPDGVPGRRHHRADVLPMA